VLFGNKWTKSIAKRGVKQTQGYGKPNPSKKTQQHSIKEITFHRHVVCDLKGKPKEKNRKGFCGPNQTLTMIIHHRVYHILFQIAFVLFDCIMFSKACLHSWRKEKCGHLVYGFNGELANLLSLISWWIKELCN
jgi:hypothetical protein